MTLKRRYPEREQFVLAWADKTKTRRDLCELFDCSDHKLREIAKHFDQPLQRVHTSYVATSKVPDPTPDEIAAMCAELRKSWSQERLLGTASSSMRHPKFVRFLRGSRKALA